MSTTSKNAFVTGASGFTGSHLVRKLVDKGYRVRALVRKTSNLDALEGLDVELVYGDVTDAATLEGKLDGIDTVFHVAAAYRQEGIPKEHFFKVNVDGTRNLLDEAVAAKVGRFVHCSTVGVQGEIHNPPATEDAPYNPGDWYQESKMEGELLALRFFRENRLPGVVVRPVGIYGPGDTRFLKLFKFIDNGKFRMLGSGEVLYHLTYVEDVVEGILLAGEKEAALGEIFTIGGPQFVPLRDLVTIIAEALERPVSRVKLPVWPFMVAAATCETVCRPLGIEPPIYRRRLDFFTKDRAFDISKARKILGYQPKVDLKTGIRITAEWYRAQGLLNGKLADSRPADS
jgi:nucleoside-diphosphate-sugar epimerase